MAHVERSDLFLRAAERLSLRGRQLDRLLEPIEWAIERDPEVFPLIEGTRFRLVTTHPVPPSIPPYRLTYSIEGDTCTLRSIGHISIGAAGSSET